MLKNESISTGPLVKKLCLGTVQFGSDYGINNKNGKVAVDEVSNILRFADECGIAKIDTASAYGESEKVLGALLSEGDYKFQLISKLSLQGGADSQEHFEQTLKNLQKDTLYGYLIHNFETFKNNECVYKILENLREEKKVKKIGFSLYLPEDLEYILEHKVDFDLVQVPYNVLDRRFESYFPRLKEKSIEVHVRSVFLQGLLIKTDKELPDYFSKIREKIRLLHDCAKEKKMSISSLCLNFAACNLLIDYFVVGVDGIGQLKENVKALNSQEGCEHLGKELELLREDDEAIILPMNWK